MSTLHPLFAEILDTHAAANVATARAIRTEHVCPPIPSRDYDWSAVFDGYEPGDPIGTGATEAEAIEWLHAEQAVYEEWLAREPEPEPEEPEPSTGNPTIDRHNGAYAQWEDRDE